MLLQETKVNVERSSNFPETGFKIKASAKAFKILSSGLYSDKIRAIVRELGTNAADAQMMAGKPDRKFTVHLPNPLEPWFSIRDYGTGLSDEEINGIYTTYFESNKTQNNDVTGCLGLGSKSPFSYTDNFTVVSYYNGKKTTYTAFMNEHGLPSVANLNEEDTQEENGLEVTFPVQSRDFVSFASKAEQVYTYFKVQPEIVGASNVKFSKLTPDYSGVGWKLFRNDNTHLLIMGNVAYPINLHEAGCWNHLFASVCIHIECPIGEAEMTASREALEYTDRTKAVIKKAVEQAIDSWTQFLLADLASQPTYWDACLFYNEYQFWIPSGTEWNGRKVKLEIKLEPAPDVSICKPMFGTKVKYRTNQTIFELHVSNNIIFVEDDLERGTKLRAMQYVRQNGFKQTLMFFKFADQAAKQQFADMCGFPVTKFIKSSSLPKVVRQKNPNAGRKVVYEFDTNGHNNRTYWNTLQLADVSSGVYVELDKWQVKGFHNAATVGSIVSSLKAAGYPVEVFGIRKNVIKKVVGNKNWISLSERIKQIQQEHDKDRNFILNASNYLQYSSLRLFKDKVSGVDIGDFVAKIEYVQKNEVNFRKLAPVMRIGVKDTDWMVPELDSIKKKYPLLFFIMEGHTSREWPVSDMIEYINMVNKA
jgi:hypothetical protein